MLSRRHRLSIQVFVLLLKVPRARVRDGSGEMGENEVSRKDKPRTELSTFLRTKRAQMSKNCEAIGEPRRAPAKGLRREDVAYLTHVSLTWYTWLEQGRDISVSARFLSRLARVLNLNEAERRYLFRLCGREVPRGASTLDASQVASPQLERLLHAIQGPAFVINMRWDIVAANQYAMALFGVKLSLPAGSPNVLKLIFLDKAHRALMPDWENDARKAVAKFRLDVYEAGIEEMDQLVCELLDSSREFRGFWRDAGVASRKEESRIFARPAVGVLRFNYSLFDVADRPGLRLNVYIAEDDESDEKLRLLTLPTDRDR